MIELSRLRTTVELLDLVRQQQKSAGKPDSDYQVAMALSTTPQRVSNWRTGRHGMEDDVGFQVADLLGLPAEYVMACLYAERAKSDRARAFWKGVALRAANLGSLAVLALLPFAWWALQ